MNQRTRKATEPNGTNTRISAGAPAEDESESAAEEPRIEKESKRRT